MLAADGQLPPETVWILSRSRLILGAPARRCESLAALGAKIFSVGAAPDRSVDGLVVRARSPEDLPFAATPEIEIWASIEMPQDREAWAATTDAYRAAGATGVIVPWNERLIDLLRNPNPDDRSDLLMSTG